MALYTYKAEDSTGKVFSGDIKVNSKERLHELLLEKGLTPLSIKEKNAITDITQISFLKKKVKIKDLAVFCRQFAVVLEAGVSISVSLDVLRLQTENPTLKECVNDIYESIQKGISLTKAMKMFQNIFPDILINMVEAGEVSGQLDKVFVKMADHFEKEYKLNAKVKGAMAYPMIVSIVAVLVIMVLMTFVLPSFAEVLEGLNLELPLITKILIGVSKFFRKFWWLNIGIIITLVLFTIRYSKSIEGKRFFSSLALVVPVFKKVTQNIITARFARTLSTLIASGVSIVQGLMVVQKVQGNAVVAEKLDKVIEEIKKGRGLSKPLTDINFFPPMIISMVSIGEESGELDFTLQKSAEFFEQEVEASVQKMVTFIEPLIIIILAVVIGFIVLSVLFPMISIYQNIGN